MEITDLLKKLMENVHVVELHGPDCAHEDADYSTWNQVARLGQDDILKHKTYLADLDKARRDIEVQIAKLEAIKATALARKAEWWAYIRERYQLPGKIPLHLAEDGRILTEPEKERKP